MECFATSGYTATTVRDIAAAAGVTGAMINYYFGSKEALYTQIAEMLFAALTERVNAAFDAPADSWEERLRVVLYAYLDFAIDSLSASQFLIDATYGTRGGRPEIDGEKLHSRLERRLRALISEAGASGELTLRDGYTAAQGAELVFMTVEHSVLRWLRHPGEAGLATRATLRSQLDHLLDAILAGLGAGPPTKRRKSSRPVSVDRSPSGAKKKRSR